MSARGGNDPVPPGRSLRGPQPLVGAYCVRRALVSDVPAVVGLLRDDPIAAARETGENPAYVAAFEAIDRSPDQLLVVVTDERDGVVATLQLTFSPGLSRGGALRGQIEAVRVGAGHRGAGVGSALLGWAVEESRRRGAGLVQLTTDRRRDDALRFYERHGFVATHVGMKRVLTEP